jgi:hypothetical protein
MALRFNGIEIPTSGDVSFNGMSFSEVRFNGSVFWKKGGSTTIPAPEFCYATTNLSGKILVTWDYSTFLVMYEIYRDGTLVGTSADESLSYEDVNVQPNRDYVYKVRACRIDNSECSDFSPEATGRALDVPTQPPTYVPDGLIASDGTSKVSVYLEWTNTDTTVVDVINVWRDSHLIAALDPAAVSYHDYSAEPGVVYDYWLTYYNFYGDGPESDHDTGFRDTDYEVPDHTHEPVDIVPQGDGSGLDADMLDGMQPDQLPVSASMQSELDTKPTGGWTWDSNMKILSITIP